jgi:glycosyltransferase involved in cell wall biosynthesis
VNSGIELRVALVSTAAVGQPGSMRAYAETVAFAIARHAPEIDVELVELDPDPPRGAWRRRLSTLMIPVRAWRQRRRSPDLWHVLDGSRAFLASALGPRPKLVTMHDMIPWLQGSDRLAQVDRAGSASRNLWKRNARALRTVEEVLCISEATRSDVISQFRTDPARTRTLHNPLRPDLAALLPAVQGVARRPGRVLHVGNNAPYKNRAGVLKLFARLPSSIATELAMCGPAPGSDLLELAQGLGISNRIEWIVDLDDKRLAREYAQASLLPFPSLYEGFGWPVLEAMAFGLPVVASDAPALREVIGAAAPCIGVDDEAAWTSASLELLQSPQAAATAARLGRDRATAFGIEAFADGIRDAYLRTAGRAVESAA